MDRTMLLLEPVFLSVYATAIGVCIVVGLIACTLWWLIGPHPKTFPALVLAIIAFSMLGFVTGSIMGNSRDAAVGAVLPAVLTLIGGIAIYLIGAKGLQSQSLVSILVLCFAMTLYVGTHYGARLRLNFEMTTKSAAWTRDHEMGVEANRYAIEVQRLLNYVELLKLKRDFSEQEKLDLSKFDTSLEHKESAAKKELPQ